MDLKNILKEEGESNSLEKTPDKDIRVHKKSLFLCYFCFNH